MPLVTQVDGFMVTPSNVIDGGDAVAVEGRYTGTVKATGARLDAQFVHVYGMRDGKIVRFQQYTDTAQWASAGRLIGASGTLKMCAYVTPTTRTPVFSRGWAVPPGLAVVRGASGSL